MTCTVRPDRSSFLSLPPAKNPMNRLSCDQNGKDAPSVPANIWDVNESKLRNQRIGGPVPWDAAKVIMRPSGETAICGVGPAVSVDVNLVSSGNEMEKRTACSAVALCGRYLSNAVASKTMESVKPSGLSRRNKEQQLGI